MPVHRCAPESIEAFLRKLQADGEQIITAFRDDADVVIVTNATELVRRGAA